MRLPLDTLKFTRCCVTCVYSVLTRKLALITTKTKTKFQKLFLEFDDSTTSVPAPTESEAEKIKEKTIEMADKVAHELGIPTWGLVAIIIGVCVVILGICFCCIRRCCRKRRGKDGKKGMKGVDLKSVQLLGSAYKEKVFLFSCLAIIKNFVSHVLGAA